MAETVRMPRELPPIPQPPKPSEWAPLQALEKSLSKSAPTVTRAMEIFAEGSYRDIRKIATQLKARSDAPDMAVEAIMAWLHDWAEDGLKQAPSMTE
jgi:hypothetical protein